MWGTRIWTLFHLLFPKDTSQFHYGTSAIENNTGSRTCCSHILLCVSCGDHGSWHEYYLYSKFCHHVVICHALWMGTRSCKWDMQNLEMDYSMLALVLALESLYCPYPRAYTEIKLLNFAPSKKMNWNSNDGKQKFASLISDSHVYLPKSFPSYSHVFSYRLQEEWHLETFVCFYHMFFDVMH